MSSPPLLRDTPPPASPTADRPAGGNLSEVITRIREHIVTMCASAEGGHLGSSMSLVEILAVLYFRVLRHDPGFPGLHERDILLLSKGHGGLCLFATLCEAGYFPAGELEAYARPGSHLTAHPHPGIPGVEMASGSLGHGLAVGVGHALGHKLEGSDRRCFIIMGDGELQEGSVWEAASIASAWRLGNITAIVDRNGLQISGPTESVGALEPLADRWRAFGWRVLDADGHDTEALTAALSLPPDPEKPTVLIARTLKGKGIPQIEGQARSHYARLGRRQQLQLLKALRADAESRR